MTGQLRSEVRKLRTTRTMAVLVLAAAALTLLGVCIEGLTVTIGELARANQQRTLLGAGSAGGFFATLAGVVAVTSEFRYGTIRPTLLFEPRRRVVLAAKLAAAALAGALLTLVCMGVSLGGGLVVLSARDVGVVLTGSDMSALLFGSIAAGAFGAMLGVAIGTLIRNQVGAILALVAYAFLVDALLFSAVPSVGRFLPGKAGDALSGQPVEHLLTPLFGAAVLVAWTLALVAGAAVRGDRSDV